MNHLIEQGVSLIIPVYNEAQSLPFFLQELEQFLQRIEYPMEVVLVDDGSVDGTPEILEQLPYKAIRHDVNLGYGAAIKTGIQNADYEAVVILDSDGTYRFEDIPCSGKPGSI